MKILFIICPSLGIGEIYTSIKLGETLLQEKNEIYYVGTSAIKMFPFIMEHVHAVLTMDKEKNNIILQETMDEVKPDRLIFTDYNMYIRNSSMNEVIELDILEKFQIPFYIIDTLGNCTFQDEKVSLFREEESIIVPRFTTGILRPVPQHDPRNLICSSRVKHFFVFHTTETKEPASQSEIKRRLGLDENRETVVLTLGNWVKKVTSKEKFKVYLNLIRLVLHYLDCVGIPIEVVVLGECNFDYTEFPNLIINKELIDLSFEETDKLFSISSLLITLNRFSNSLCRATLYQTPCMTLLNSKRIELNGPEQYKSITFPLTKYVKRILRLMGIESKAVEEYIIFPESSTDLLRTFYEKNPEYSEITPWYEIFDEETVVQEMKKLFLQKEDTLKMKQKHFIERASLLQSPSQILKELSYGTCNPD